MNIRRTGPPADIDAHVRSVLEVAHEGGVIVGPHSIAADIPVEHYEAYDRVMREQS